MSIGALFRPDQDAVADHLLSLQEFIALLVKPVLLFIVIDFFQAAFNTVFNDVAVIGRRVLPFQTHQIFLIFFLPVGIIVIVHRLGPGIKFLRRQMDIPVSGSGKDITGNPRCAKAHHSRKPVGIRQVYRLSQDKFHDPLCV